jgi:hypothetical protein
MNTYNITESRYLIDIAGNNFAVNATIDGVEMFVPLDAANRHYAAILEWVDAGNTVAAAD